MSAPGHSLLRLLPSPFSPWTLSPSLALSPLPSPQFPSAAMDFSSLTEAPQQQQQQPEQQQSYNPAQSHAYEAYYGYHQQPYDASASHHQYYYQDYAAAYHHQQHAAAAAQDPSGTSALGTSQVTQHQGAGAPGVPGYAQDHQGSYPVPPGLNPAAAAAVAALSQLSQFAGNMDAAERAMAGMQGRQWHGKGVPGMGGQTPHRPIRFPAQRGGMRRGAGGRAGPEVGGRRGGGPFRGGRGGGRANLGHHSLGPDSGAPLFRGRGRGAHRGRGGGRRSHQSAKTSAAEIESAERQVSGLAPVQLRQPCLPIAWCDICRVDCNSLEILEQHKSGKRHKRTVQRFEEIQAQQKLLAEFQAQSTLQGFDGTMTQPQLMAESQEGVIKHPEAVVQVAKENMIDRVGEEIKTSAVSQNSQEVSSCENTIKNELQGQIFDEQKVRIVDEQIVSAETEGIIYIPPSEGPTRVRPPKRKMMRFGRAGKKFRYFRSTEGRPQEHPKEQRPKEQRPKEPPRVCTLCNVMCESQVVFDSHIAGKKHISRIKRFQGNAVFGPLEVYIPPNQPSVSNPPGLQPQFFGLQTQEMVPLLAHEPSLLMETSGSHQPEHGEPAVLVSQMGQAGGSRSGEGLGMKDCAVVTEVKADVVTTTENVAVEGEAACRLIEHVSAETEMAFEIEHAVEAETTFAMVGDDVLQSEAAVMSGNTVAEADTD